VTSPRPLAILDFVHRSGDQSAAHALADTVAVARLAEELGYARYWVPEHHNGPGLGFTSNEVLIAHLAAATSSIRVGAAGIMLPNHAPLKVAEVFRTLEALHPGRIDLGLGRAPGTDGLTAYALRGRDPGTAGDEFPDLAAHLLAFLGDGFPPEHPYSKVLAAPVVDTTPDVFMLGSSAYGPQFSAVNGMATVFAHHMSPELAVDVLRAYRRDFRPGHIEAPRAGVSVLAYATDDPDDADLARASWSMLVNRIRRGERGPGPSLEEVAAHAHSGRFAEVRRSLDGRLFAGPPDRVAEQVADLAERAGADEVAVVSPISDRARRTRALSAFIAAWRRT
jgi:luciferase family oxidoreductase group 1